MAQVEKRKRKLEPLRSRQAAVETLLTDDADTLVVTFGSTVGAVDEAVGQLRQDGVKAGRVQVRQVWPLPDLVLRPLLALASRVLIVEQNATGELRQLMRAVGLDDGSCESLLHFDGTLLAPERVVAAAASLPVQEEV